jgi:SlyX protein
MEDRVSELELKYMEQQAALQALSDVIYAQGRSLERLEAELSLLRKRLEAEPGIVDARADEKPPHY